MKKIFHIFPAKAPQTTIPLIRYLLSDVYSEFDNKFIVYGKIDNNILKKYQSLVELNEQRIFICQNVWLLFLTIFKNRIKSIVSHSDSYFIRIIPLMLGLKVTWVCWGATTNISGSLLSYVAYPLKYLINNRLHKIITLMLADKKELENNYNLKNVIVLPYPASPDEERNKLEYFNKPQNNPLRILIGNSGHCYPWYKNTLQQLVKFKDDVEIHCMFQYPFLPEKIEELSKYGEKLFNNNFFVDVELLSKHDYYKYISSFDIYICPKPTQSGLGAIHTSLFFGKKVYITGKNLEWEQYIGTKVFDIDSLVNTDISDFFKQLTLAEKEHNRRMIIKNWNRISEWLDLYKSI